MPLTTASTVYNLIFTQATPLVGDYSNFKASVTVDGQTHNGTLEFALVAKTATGFKMTQTTKFNNQPSEHREEDVKTEDLINDETITYVLANCAAQNGQLQNVTVPAGTFNSCVITQDNSTVWIAKVPFGVAKQTHKSPEGHVSTLELQSFVHGKAK